MISFVFDGFLPYFFRGFSIKKLSLPFSIVRLFTDNGGNEAFCIDNSQTLGEMPHPNSQ